MYIIFYYENHSNPVIIKLLSKINFHNPKLSIYLQPISPLVGLESRKPKFLYS